MLLDDLRFAARALTRNRGLTLVAILVAGLGIGVVTSLFNLANGLLYRPLPYDRAERLAAVTEDRPGEATAFSRLSPTSVEILRGEASSLEEVWVYRDRAAVLGSPGGAVRLRAVETGPELFAGLGIEALHGRVLQPADAGEPVAVLGHGPWVRLYGADPSVVGRTVRVDGEPHTLVGVMPPRFGIGADRAGLFLPMEPLPSSGEEADRRSLAAIALLAPGASRAEAATEVSALSAPLARAVDGRAVLRLRDDAVDRGRYFRGTMWIFLGGAALLLVVSCSNVAGLLLARGARRRSEVAVRAALGGSRGRIFRQTMAEALLLAVAAGAAGLLASLWLADIFVRALPTALPWWAEVGVIDARILLAVGSTIGVTVLLVGVAPALEAARVDLVGGLVSGAKGATEGRRQRRLRSGVVGVQIALSFLLLVVSAMAWRSSRAISTIDLGWPADQVVVGTLDPDDRFEDRGSRDAHLSEVARRVQAIPGVEAATWSGRAGELLDSAVSSRSEIVAPGTGRTLTLFDVELRAVQPDFFRISGLPLVAGRTVESTASAEAVVGEGLAREVWGDEPPVGRTLRVSGVPLEVVGVAAEPVRVMGGARGLRAERPASLYVPFSASGVHAVELRARASEPGAVLTAVRAAALEVDPDLPFLEVRTAEEAELGAHEQITALFGSFAALLALMGVGLSAAGLYGLIAYSVALRTREIGIRTALGATPERVLGSVLGGSAGLSLVALLAGGVLAALASRVLGTFLLRASVFDPLAWSGSALVVVAVVVAASALPARRALHLDTVRALRSE